MSSVTKSGIAIILFIFIMGFLSGAILEKDVFGLLRLEDRAIQAGYAHHHPKTGDIVWDDEQVRKVIQGGE